MDIVEILRVGLPGLVFLLSLLSYRLLAKEQNKKEASVNILKGIKHFMHVNILLAILTISAPIAESFFNETPSGNKFSAEARQSDTGFDMGRAAVCADAKYGGRYVLLTDETNTRMVQVYAMGILPCDGDVIALNENEAKILGLTTRPEAPMLVGVSAAAEGQMYTIDTIGD